MQNQTNHEPPHTIRVTFNNHRFTVLERRQGGLRIFALEFIVNKTHKSLKVRKKAKIRNRYNQVPHRTQYTTWESDNNTRKHNTQESQEISPFPAGDHKAAMNRQDSMKDTKHN